MPENIEDIYELAPMQQGILFDSLYAPDSGAYNLQLSCLLRGELNVEAFERAWRQVVDRHTSLRTSFHWEELDKPLQLVSERVDLPVELLDWRGPSREEQREMLKDFLRADYRRGFDLTSAPLMRLTLIRLEDDLHHFVWSYHHLVTDGWSGPLIFKEVFTFYRAYSQNLEVSMEPSRPYGDYISWLQAQDTAAAESFWRETLKGFTSPNLLQIERTAGAQSDADERDAQCQLKLSAETTAALRRVTQQHQLTLNTIVQGAWAILLARYSGNSDVVFGAVVSNRPAEVPGVEQIVGVFINTLPVRAQIAWDEPVMSWLKKLQRQSARARQYEYTPLVQVQGWSDVPRGVPLFETALIFENYPMDVEAVSGPAVGLEITEVQTVDRSSIPVSLMVEPGTQLSLQLIYDQRRFDRETISRLLGHLKLLLEGMIADPGGRVSQLPLLSETERRQLLTVWNNTRLEYARRTLLHELIEAQAEARPEATAVVFEERQFTYRELNERANQLAHHLRALDVRSESLVGVLMERSAEMLVALLGILKAGAAYVPLDPDYPQERLAFMLEDSRAQVLLTEHSQLERHDWISRIKTRAVLLDIDLPISSQLTTEKPRDSAAPDDLAYVIYTSGSTGKPKGVEISHRALVNFMAAMQRLFNLRERDVLVSVTSLSFDIAGLELYLPLTVGASVVLASRQVIVDHVALREQLVKSEASIMQATPSTWRMLLEANWDGDSRLRILCGGEALPRELATQLVNRCGELWNMYGPTETTIWSLSRRIEPDHNSITIGFPIANTQVYVFDEQMLLVAVGVPGELYIGGDGLARGYLRRPGLTAERFVPDPHAARPGRRLYRTGDLVRYLPDGSLEFLGRMDQQVKVRGHRIELGEIEAALESHNYVQQCIALVREDIPGDKRIIAYVVFSDEQTKTDSGSGDSTNVIQMDEAVRQELWSHVRGRLPEYMAPSAFVLMSRMPLTPNGKVDRKALPAPSTAGSKREASGSSPPRSHLEDALAGLWAEVLGIEGVSPADNFFELGGHSLLAMQVVSRVRDRFGAEVGVGRLFAAPTLSGFAAEVERALREGEGLAVPPLLRAERNGASMPLSFAQQRLWFLEQLEPGTPLYNIPAAVRLKGRLDTAALGRALDEIVRRHEVLRTSFVIEGGEPMQVIAASAHLALEEEEVQGQEEGEREAWVLEAARQEARRGFDLGRGPLLRVRLLRLTEEEHVALLTMHHIVSDGWSMGVFVRELAALYEAYAAGKESPLGELPIQYADYAVWQREWLAGEVLERQMAYWRKQLAGAPGTIELPADYTRPVAQTYRGASESGEVGEAVSAKLRELSRREGVTLYVTMLAAFKALLWRYGGGSGGAGDVVVGTPVAGRGRMETEGLVGFFVNTLVLRTNVGDNPSFRELLKQVRQVVLGAYNHQDLPFVKLVEALNPERQSGSSPLVQVCFFLDTGPMALLELPGITLSPVETTTGVAQFDLILGVSDTGPRLATNMQYNADLFAPTTIRLMLSLYEILLSEVVAEPESRLSELNRILAEAEEQQRMMREKRLEELSFGNLRRIKRKAVDESHLETTA